MSEEPARALDELHRLFAGFKRQVFKPAFTRIDQSMARGPLCYALLTGGLNISSLAFLSLPQEIFARLPKE